MIRCSSSSPPAAFVPLRQRGRARAVRRRGRAAASLVGAASFGIAGLVCRSWACSARTRPADGRDDALLRPRRLPCSGSSCARGRAARRADRCRPGARARDAARSISRVIDASVARRPAASTRGWMRGGARGDVRLAVALGAVALVLGGGLGAALLLAATARWRSTGLDARAGRRPLGLPRARGVGFIGAVVRDRRGPLGVAAAFLVAQALGRLAFVVASAASAGLVIAQGGIRARAPEDILVAVDPGSFPRHTANAATIAVLLGRPGGGRWAAGAAYVVLMALTRTTSAHWAATPSAARSWAGAAALAGRVRGADARRPTS